LTHQKINKEWRGREKEGEESGWMRRPTCILTGGGAPVDDNKRLSFVAVCGSLQGSSPFWQWNPCHWTKAWVATHPSTSFPSLKKKKKKKKKKKNDAQRRSIPVIPQPRSKKNLKMKGVRGEVASNAGGSGSYWYLWVQKILERLVVSKQLQNELWRLRNKWTYN
jgi:hypothetical protein